MWQIPERAEMVRQNWIGGGAGLYDASQGDEPSSPKSWSKGGLGSWSRSGDDDGGHGLWRKDVPVSPVPLPSSVLLFGSGLLGLTIFRRRAR